MKVILIIIFLRVCLFLPCFSSSHSLTLYISFYPLQATSATLVWVKGQMLCLHSSHPSLHSTRKSNHSSPCVLLSKFPMQFAFQYPSSNRKSLFQIWLKFQLSEYLITVSCKYCLKAFIACQSSLFPSPFLSVLQYPSLFATAYPVSLCEFQCTQFVFTFSFAAKSICLISWLSLPLVHSTPLHHLCQAGFPLIFYFTLPRLFVTLIWRVAFHNCTIPDELVMTLLMVMNGRYIEAKFGTFVTFAPTTLATCHQRVAVLSPPNSFVPNANCLLPVSTCQVPDKRLGPTVPEPRPLWRPFICPFLFFPCVHYSCLCCCACVTLSFVSWIHYFIFSQVKRSWACFAFRG